jgi:hypothetical protein
MDYCFFGVGDGEGSEAGDERGDRGGDIEGMSARFKIGDRVWSDGKGWEITNCMVGPSPFWSAVPMYLGRNLIGNIEEVWLHDDQIERTMTEEEVVGEIMRGRE